MAESLESSRRPSITTLAALDGPAVEGHAAMDALELLLTRESAPRLSEPGPGRYALEGMLASATRAPDHGRIRPWRFIIIEGEGREALGEVLARSLERRKPGISEELLRAERAKPLRAPLIIVVAAELQDHPKVPQIEQILSAGAAAEHIMLAAQAFGFGAMWKTGDPAYDDTVKVELGLDTTDAIVGFLYVGTRVGRSAPLPRPKFEDHTVRWPG